MQQLCSSLDAGYQLGWPGGSMSSAAAAVNRDLLPADQIPVPVLQALRQQTLSKALDRALVAQLSALVLVAKLSVLTCNSNSNRTRGLGCRPRPALPWA